jgi:hypothetical protein
MPCPIARIETPRLVLEPYGLADGDWQLVLGVYREGQLIGEVELAVDEGETANLGLGIDEQHRGQGYATEAAGALVRVALATGMVGAVEVRCDQGDVAGMAVARRIGFAFTAGLGGIFGELDRAAFAEGPAGRLPIRALDADGQELMVAPPAELDAIWAELGAALEERFGDEVPVAVSLVSAVGEPAVRFSARVASEHAVAMPELFARNARLAVGAYGVDGGHIVLRHVAPLASLSVAWAVRTVALLASEARRAAGLLAKPDPSDLVAKPDPHVFSAFAD